MGLAKFDISCAPGGGTIIVNGDDVSLDVTALSLIATGRDVPRLTLELFGSGTLTGEGIVEVAVRSDDWAQAAVAFLDQLDPAEVERVALENAGWGDGNMTATLIRTIREMLVGDTPRP